MTGIVRAETAHIPAVLQIEEASFRPAWSRAALLSELCNEDARFAVAMDASGSVLGFYVLRRAADEAELHRIAVAGHARRRAVGSALLDDAVSWARAAGLARIFLEVRRSNGPAVALYEKHGFAAVGYRRGYYSDPVEDAAVMALTLPAADSAQAPTQTRPGGPEPIR